MDFNATIDLIIRELEEAREIIDDLKNYPGAPLLQIELAKSKCRNAAEVLAILKQVQEKQAVQPEVREEPVKQTPASKAEPVKEIEHKPFAGKAAKADQPEPPVQEIGHKPFAGKAEEEDHTEPATDENAIAEQKPKKPYVAPIIADTFSHLANRFNEQIGENQGDEFSYTHGKHYENLSDAIGVNDRFYYIREIFDGKRDLYNEAITKLDKAQSFKDAKEILADYKTEKTSNEALKQLLDLTRRKFGMHE